MTPEENIVFSDTIKKMIETEEILIDGNPNINFVRGISLKESNRMFINLGATQYKTKDEDAVTKLITETIIHEYVHLLCKDYTSVENSIVEEKVCMLLAGQIENMD